MKTDLVRRISFVRSASHRRRSTSSGLTRALGWCAGVVLLACSDATGLGLVRLAQNRGLWNSHGLHSYTFIQTDSCFCEFSGQAVAVHVDADTVTSVQLVSTGALLDKNSWQTIPELFDRAAMLVRSGGFDVTLKFDEMFGYPTLIEYSCSADILDCGGSTTIQLQTQLD